MANIIYLSENASKGIQVSAELLAMLQSTEKTLEEAFVCMMGNNGIVCGCVETDGVYSPGLIIWNNELFYFEGGSFGAFLVVNSVTTNCVFCSGDTERIFTVRTAKLSDAVLPEQTYLVVTEGLPELYHPEYTFFTLDAQVQTNTENIASMLIQITALEGVVPIDYQPQIDVINDNIANQNLVIINQQAQIDFIMAHLYDCCGGAEPPAPSVNPFADVEITLQSECIQGQIGYEPAAGSWVVPVGISAVSVLQKVLYVPTATPLNTKVDNLINRQIKPFAPSNTMRAEIANLANTGNKFKLEVQYTESAIVKTGWLFFDLPHFANYSPGCTTSAPIPVLPTGWESMYAE